MTVNGIFFDLYGTLLVYGNMDAAWSDTKLTPFVARGPCASQY